MKWIRENPEDQHLSEEIKKDFLSFNTLPQEKKVQLRIALSKLLAAARLPMEIEKWLLSDFDALANELLLKIGSHLKDESDMSSLVSTSKRMYSLFQPARLLNKFLQRIAYGEQDKAERLFTAVYQGNVEKIQQALLYQGKFTDYSGRTFKCSAYEYAYWAKDTHMCRMLEAHMDEETKAEMAARINEMERIDEATSQPVGLVYSQAGQAHRSAHFDFTPLKEAYRSYLDDYNGWLAAQNWAAIDAAWWDMGKAQRNVPAHVAQEYCRPDRSFNPRPEFNEATLPRVLTCYNWTTGPAASWFPLAASNSGLGFNFVLVRCAWRDGAAATGRGVVGEENLRLDLAAVSRLDEVRTVELKLSREHLNPQAHAESLPKRNRLE